ncbi:MAG: glutathione S-transferase C-terminal domain-containing protein [Deltaproteobacteria bacterium]|nr:glutathione S-transferase C-terminal domain-containing protein [Deltaproteobacteria bacterium]MBW2722751.1 glutathione S-transferase C-terminal domain-containing protein [Deltaproteobacteria bacterium]
MTIELWTAPTPNGWKVTIMVEELIEAGVDLPNFEMRTINLAAGEQFTKEFTQKNPNQKIPVLLDGATSIMESCAILQYLGEKYPTTLLPAGGARWDVLQWLYWQAANVGPAFGNKLSYTRYMSDVDDVLKSHPLERFGKEARRLVAVLDKRLEGRDYVCGDTFTIADIAIYPWVRGWKWSKVDITDRPGVMGWVDRVRARPGVGRGLAYGVPEDEIDRWSEKRRAQYAKGGASIAGNEKLRSDL